MLISYDEMGEDVSYLDEASPCWDGRSSHVMLWQGQGLQGHVDRRVMSTRTYFVCVRWGRVDKMWWPDVGRPKLDDMMEEKPQGWMKVDGMRWKIEDRMKGWKMGWRLGGGKLESWTKEEGEIWGGKRCFYIGRWQATKPIREFAYASAVFPI